MGWLMSMECDEAGYAVKREIGIGVSWEGSCQSREVLSLSVMQVAKEQEVNASASRATSSMTGSRRCLALHRRKAYHIKNTSRGSTFWSDSLVAVEKSHSLMQRHVNWAVTG